MSSYTVAVTPSVPTSDPAMRDLDRAIQALHAHTPLQFFHWDATAAPTVFNYVIRAVDMRTFSQVYTFDGSAEQPTISTGGSAWSLAEINLHRDIRATLLLIVTARAVTSLRATFG